MHDKSKKEFIDDTLDYLKGLGNVECIAYGEALITGTNDGWINKEQGDKIYSFKVPRQKVE